MLLQQQYNMIFTEDVELLSVLISPKLTFVVSSR